MNTRKFLLPILAVSIFLFFSSCSQYQQVVKSDDFAWKFQKAKEYYEKGDYFKALPLFEELMSYYKGTKQMEEIYYFYAYTFFHTDEYLLAAYHFKNFSTTYPSNATAEECLFMNAKCYYIISPDFELEQSYTGKALDELQLFVNTYPASKRVPDCNQMMDELRSKLEEKSFAGANLYFRMGKYNAAAFAFANVLKEFPDSPDAEYLMYMGMRSNYLYALNSITEKQKERFETALTASKDFLDQFPESEYLDEAKQIEEQILKNLSNLNKPKTDEQEQAQQ